jgi:DNA-binding NtrC family response regulator
VAAPSFEGDGWNNRNGSQLSVESKIVMSIGLFATESLPLGAVASLLRAEGFDARVISKDEIRNLHELDSEISKAVLLIPKHGAGDPAASFKPRLTRDRPLILCTPQPDPKGYETLTKVGAAAIITPRSWSAEHLAERILAQLILDGDVTPSACGPLRGATLVMREAYAEMEVIAPFSDPLLITGETGTGKELVASEIHRLSKRPPQLFMALNCGAQNKELIASELFGHQKGGFTGAVEARRGLIANAGDGTVFLDEIGELDLQSQASLLRVLEDKKVRRVGSNQIEDAPARVVLATNRDLQLECEAGRFRIDLFERIRGFTINLQPLRKRRADIPLLSEHLLTEFNRERKTKVKFPPGSLDSLFDYDWPGNVRELRAAIRLAAAFADADGFLNAWRLSEATRRARSGGSGKSTLANAKYYLVFDPEVDTWKTFSARAHKTYFQAALDAAGGNRKEARKLTALGSSQFYESLKTISSGVAEGEQNEDE